MPNTATLYIGTYSVRGSEGIYQVEIDLDSGAMQIASSAPASDPSYLALSPDSRTLYAVEETAFQEGLTPSVTAYEIAADGSLSQRKRLPIPGNAPCHLTISPDARWLVTSNYSDGSNTVVALDPSGELSHVVQQSVNAGELGPHERQEAPHAHFAQFRDLGPAGWRVYSCDLGLDSVIVFAFDRQNGQLTPLETEGATLPPSAGPRHLAFHPRLPVVYVFGELDSAIYAYWLNPSGRPGEGARLELAQALPTLPPDYQGVHYGAAIRVSPDGRAVTVSNRVCDTLASFSINAETGLLAPLGEVSCGGEWPRDFAYVGRDLLVVANERSDNLTAFRIAANGLPTPLKLPDTRLALPSPACVAVAAA